MTAEEKTDILEAKRRAKAEVLAYRERLQAERQAKARAEETADEEIGRMVRARREEEAKRAEIRAQLDALYARREAALEAQRRADAAKRLITEPRQVAETSARRLAKMLRRRLGDDFDAFMADLKTVEWSLFKIEVARIPDDERCEAVRLEREARAAEMAAAAATLPAPEDDAERAILAKHGFPA